MRHSFFVLLTLALICSGVWGQSIDLAGYWKFDDGSGSSSVVDETGTSHGFVRGRVGLGDLGVNSNSSSAVFGQSRAYIEIPHHDDFLLNEGTVVFWFNTTTTSGRQGIFSKDSSGKDTGGHLTIYLQGRQLKVRMQSTSTSYDLKSSINIVKNRWYHVALVFGPGGMELYINGRLDKTHRYSGGLGINSVGVGNYEPMVIGSVSWMSGDRVATPVHDHFHGKIDEVAILSNRLDGATVADIYKQTGTGGSLNLGDLSSSPPVYYVRKDGSDSNDGLSPEQAFKTIQHAVSQCVRAGTTVYVGPGAYAEGIKISKKMNRNLVSGTRSAPIRLIADPEGKFTLDAPGEVVLDGRGVQRVGFEIFGVKHWSIDGFSIRNQRDYAVYVIAGGVSMTNCTIEVPQRLAVYARPVDDITISKCNFERDISSGSMVFIFPMFQRAAPPATITITRNDMAMKGDLYLSRPYANGTLSSSDGGNGSIRFQNGIVVLNLLPSNVASIEISNNLISDSSLGILTSLRQRESTDLIIANNTIVGSRFSIYTWRYRNGQDVIVNNIIDSCRYGLLSRARRGKPALVSGLLEHNIEVQMARFGRHFEFDVITGNPLFVDPLAGDFSLSKGSPAIDVGDPAYAPGVDIAGRERPVDGDEDGIPQVDLGVTELVGVGGDRVRVVRWREIGGQDNQ